MNKIRLLSVFLGIVAAMISQPQIATAADPSAADATPGGQSGDSHLVRELRVPFADLEALLGSETNRVFMSRSEYEDLKKAAEQEPDSKLPHRIALLDANYQASIREGRALVRGSLKIEVLDESLRAIPLDFAEVGIRVAQLDGAPARLAHNADGKTIVFVQGKGLHDLIVEFVMPVAVDAAQQTVRFGVPVAPSSRLALEVPGNVEVKSGASIIDRAVDETLDLTRFEIIPTPGTMALTMSLNNRKRRDQTTVMARGVIVSEVTEAYERLHASMSMAIVNGATDELRFVVDEDLEVDSVTCDLLSRWEIEQRGDEKQLVVRLRAPTTELVVVNVRLDRGRPEFVDWNCPKFEPVDVAGYTAVVGLVTEDRLQVSQLRPDSLFTIDSSVLVAATASSMFAEEPGAPRVKAIAAYYSASANYGLSAQLALPPASLSVNASSLFEISDGGVGVSGGVSLSPEHEKLFSFDLLLPPDWKLLWVRDGSRSELKFDRYDDGGGTRVRVLLPKGIEVDGSQTVWFKAEFTPPDWLGTWQQQTIELPAFPVVGAREHQGVIAVQTRDDLQAIPESTDNLVVVGKRERAKHQLEGIETALAYHYEAMDWNASIRLERQAARQTARVLSFLKVETEAFVSHSELIYLIAEAASRTLRFSLPDSTPSEISIRALDGVRIKETSSEVIDSRRWWTVELAERKSGSVRLAIDFTQPLETQEPKDARLPVVRAEAVQYQTGAIALEGHPELETTVTQSPRDVDIGELVDADYQVGSRLIGVFGYVAYDDDVVIDVTRRQIHALPSTIVQRAEMVSQVSAQGKCQTAARFQLRTKATMLESLLPSDATLWAVMLDGKPALPQRAGQRVIVAIPAGASTPSRDLQIVYETEVQPVGLGADVDLIAPQLFEREDPEVRGAAIPVADLKWDVYLPRGYRLTSADGRSIRSQRSSGTFRSMLETLFALGGGDQSGWLGRTVHVREAYSYSAAMESDEEMADYASMAPDSMQIQGLAEGMEEADAEMEMMDNLFSDIPAPADAPASGPAQPATTMFAAPQEAAEATRQSRQAPATGEVSGVRQSGRGREAKQQPWALEGVRSLAIDLTRGRDGESVSLSGLGNQSETRLSIVDARRYQWIGAIIGMIVFLIGLSRNGLGKRIRFGFWVLLLAALLPTLTETESTFQAAQSSVVVALIALFAFTVIESVLKKLCQRFCVTEEQAKASELVRSSLSSPLVLAFLVVCLSANSTNAQNDPFANNAKSVSNLEQLKALLDTTVDRPGRRPPASIPEDAVVIPYSSDGSSTGGSEEEKLLVPYKVYEELWSLAYPDKQRDLLPPAAPYAWSDVAYTTKLDGSGTMKVIGTLRLEQFVDGEQLVPLRLAGGVLEKATVDGRPAKLKLVLPSPAGQDAEQQQKSKQVAEQAGILMLHTSGKGQNEIQLEIRLKLDKSGGWRIVSGVIPSAPACSLSIEVENANTEVRLSGMTDRAAYSTTREGEVIETALVVGGNFSIRWRDQISEATIDQGLTVDSKAVFDVREDAVKLAWRAEFEFRRGRREMLSVVVPSDYVVEKILGDNVRGWTNSDSPDGQLLEVELLKPAVEREVLTFVLSKQNAITEDRIVSVSVPNPIVPDAMLQQGRTTIRRSSLLELRTGDSAGLVRIDVPGETDWFAAIEEAGPLPMETFQAYQHSQGEFTLPLSVSVIEDKRTVEVQSLVKLSQRETEYEARLLVSADDRPVYHMRIRLPDNLELETPIAPGAFQWSVLTENNQRVLEIDLADGQLGQFSVVLSGKLPVVAGQAQPGSPATMQLPSLEVLDAQRQSGAIVVQIDPAYDVRATNLQDCSVGLLSSVNRWLVGQQRQLARLVIRYGAPSYSGALTIVPRSPDVRSLAISNVKVTDRAVEETIYIEATIRSAGIDEYVFLLPAGLADARIEAPMVRQKTVVSVDESDGAPVRVRLQLQDSIMGRFAVIVQNDRLLGSGLQTVPIPVIETGETDSRMLTLENASRDELLTEEMVSVEALDRAELGKDKRLDRLGGKSSSIFRLQEVQAETTAPRLSYQTRTRETIETSGARIGLAKTLLVVDELGAYRAVQEYRIENRTEPFLEVQMPAGSRLWTVQVAGENVKPSSPSAATIRVPLIKTAEGELDYPVIMKYGGQLVRPGTLKKTDFPLMKTVNINVELSQVRLRLPRGMRWFGFDGTMGRVLDEGELQAGWLSFRTRQITDLTRLLSSKRGQYSKFRAQYNLKKLESTVAQQNSQYAALADTNAQLKRRLIDNAAALEQAQQQIVEFETQNDLQESRFGNRFALGELYESQTNFRANNVASSLGSNFPQKGEAAQLEEKRVANGKGIETNRRFDSQWLSGNKLDAKESKRKVQSRIGTVTAEPKPAREAAKKELAKQLAKEAAGQQAAQRGTVIDQTEQFAQQQIAGDYRAQAERYRRKLSQDEFAAGRTPRGQTSNAPGYAMDMDGSMMMGMTQNEDYAKAQSNAQAQPNARGYFESGGESQMGGLGDTESLGFQSQSGLGAQVGQQPSVQTRDESFEMMGGMGGFGGGMGGGMGGRVAGGADASVTAAIVPQVTTPQRAGFLASLEVELPVRGTEYLFTTTGGDLELSARSVSEEQSNQVVGSLVILAIGLLVYVTMRFLATRLRSASVNGRIVGAVLAGVAGVASLVSGYLPVYGLLLVMVSLSLALSSRESATTLSS